MKVKLNMVRDVLDNLRSQGLTVEDIARQLSLHQVHGNTRTIKNWYSGRTNCRNVEYRALCHLLNEVARNENQR